MALPLYLQRPQRPVRWQLTLSRWADRPLVAVFAVLMSSRRASAAALRTTGRTDNAIVFQRGSGSS